MILRLLGLLLVLADFKVDANSHLHRTSKWHSLGELQLCRNMTAKEAATLREDYFVQKLDHFDANETRTWKQRYQQNDAYHRDGGVEFLNIGGEAALSSGRITFDQYSIVSLAKKLGARQWTLEHRYYGKSRPTQNQSVENLVYLSSRQALEDIAEFIRAKNKQLKLESPKWVVFGGSYAGSLALWFRQKHPELTVGAVGSSAPVELVTDFFDYFRVCEQSLRSYSPSCADNIKQGFEELHDLLDDPSGRARVDEMFNLQPPLADQNLTDIHLQNLYGNIMYPFADAVQYSPPVGDEHNARSSNYLSGIQNVCATMNAPSDDSVTRLAKVFADLPGIPSNSYEADIKRLQDVSFDAPISETRSWLWQTCTEFGFFQSTDYNGIFGPMVPVNYQYNTCTDLFGAQFNVRYIRRRVRESVDYYGRARDYNATNVVAPNGNIDPWHALGMYAQNNPTVFPILINGTSHCADMSSPQETDPPGLKKAREFIDQKVREWTGSKVGKSGRGFAVEIENSGQKTRESAGKVEAKFAPPTDAKICWKCGAPWNNYKPKLAPAHLTKQFHTQDLLGLRGLRGREQPKQPTNATMSWIEQPVDHFNPNDNRTYKQKFFSNEEFYVKGGPIFLFIDGENFFFNTDFITNLNRPLVQWAKRYNASLYHLEHRFYGDSQPTKDMSIENLQFLTSEQALADAVTFIRNTNKQKGYKNPRWIAYGGSYAGGLSAWIREIYPQDVFAAIGSSAVLRAEVDNYGYLQHAQTTFQEHSKECGDSLKAAFDAIHKSMESTEGRAQLNEKIRVEPPFTANETIDAFDVMTMYQSLAIDVGVAAQWADVDRVCSKLANQSEPDPIRRLQTSRDGHTTLRNLNMLTRGLLAVDGLERAWYWQTCNEFGWYQSTDMGYNAFGSAVPINFYLRWCTDAYNQSLTRDELEKNVDRTNMKYGGTRHYKSSRVILLYGSLDPWHRVGLYSNDGSHGEDVVSIIINGTSHCADVQDPDQSTNPAAMKKALQTVVKYLDKWLGI